MWDCSGFSKHKYIQNCSFYSDFEVSGNKLNGIETAMSTDDVDCYVKFKKLQPKVVETLGAKKPPKTKDDAKSLGAASSALCAIMLLIQM